MERRSALFRGAFAIPISGFMNCSNATNYSRKSHKSRQDLGTKSHTAVLTEGYLYERKEAQDAHEKLPINADDCIVIHSHVIHGSQSSQRRVSRVTGRNK